MLTPFASHVSKAAAATLLPEECWQSLTSWALPSKFFIKQSVLWEQVCCLCISAVKSTELMCLSFCGDWTLPTLCLSGCGGVKCLSFKGLPVVLGCLLLVTSSIVLCDKLLLLLKLLSLHSLTSFQKYAKNKCKYFRYCCYYQCKPFKALSWGKLFISVLDSSFAGLSCCSRSSTKHGENRLHDLWVVYIRKNWNLLSLFQCIIPS